MVVPAASGGATVDTVLGARGAPFSVPFNTPRDAAWVAPMFDNLGASVSGGTATVYAASASPPAEPLGAAFLEATTGGAASVGSYLGYITNATSPTTLTGGNSPGELIVSGLGGLVFAASAGAGGGTVVAGGGNNQFFGQTSGTGSWNVRLGSGANTVVAGAGPETIDAGAGANLEFLGEGEAVVTSEGVDTIIGGAGIGEIDALGPGALVFAGSGGIANFTAAGGASTIAGSTEPETLTGGAGTMLSFSYGPTYYTGGSGADTIVAANAILGAGALTVAGGSGDGLYFGAPAGANSIFGGTGAATIFGGGTGDRLATGGTGLNVVAAGVGAETIDGSLSSGSNTFFLGSGADVAIGGGGLNAYQIGTGAATITGAGTGNLYVLYNLGSTGRTLDIVNFAPARDFVKLDGFAAGTATAIAAAETMASGGAGALITLPDGTRIIFGGVTAITAASFT